MKELKKRLSGLVALMLVAVLAFGVNVNAESKGHDSDCILEVGDDVSFPEFTTGGIFATNYDDVKDYIEYEGTDEAEHYESGGVVTIAQKIVIKSVPEGYKGFKWTYEGDIDIYYPTPHGGSLTPIPNSYNVKYVDAEGTELDTQDIEYSPAGAAVEAVEAPEKKGYTFTDWMIADTDYSVTDAISASFLQTKADGDTIILNPVFTANRMYIKYNANGGEGTMEADEYTVENAQDTLELKDSTFTRDGYKFVGWAMSSDDADVVTSVDADFSVDGTEVEVFAVWEEDESEDTDTTEEDTDTTEEESDTTSEDKEITDNTTTDIVEEQEETSEDVSEETSVEEKTESGDSTTTPTTGDTAPILMMALLMMISACGVVALKKKAQR